MIANFLIFIALTGCSVTISEECEVTAPEEATLQPGEPYRCADSFQNHGDGCGSEGYALGYGAKYAEIFMWETYEIVEASTQEFLVQNLLCLQESFIFETDTSMTCSELWEHAFASHVGCYVTSGACDLPTTDLVRIFTAIDDQDMGSPEQNAATEAIWDQCWG
tara:strand:+ start:95 stop:586 length:492 start_codon:yes stop_codon:yes gene_type:complete